MTQAEKNLARDNIMTARALNIISNEEAKQRLAALRGPYKV